MASHPHHHCNHHTASCSYACCSRCTPTPSPSTTPPLSIDPLLQVLASQILLQQSHQLHHPHYSAHLEPNTSRHHLQPQHHQHHKKQQIQQQEDHQTHTFIPSLLNRIDALESSLRCLSSSSPYRHQSSSIRDVAARTIQTHFRAFLVRRSRTLRNLKDLALIKSAFIALKSSISDQTHLNLVALSRKAMDLLLELDSIQGCDPMIRDGKRSISRDLVRFLDLIDGVSIKRHEFSTKAVKNVRFVQNRNKSRVLETSCRGLGGRDQRETMDKLRDRVRNIEGYARVSENDEEEVELEGFHQGSDDEQIAGVSQIRNGILLKKHGVQSRLKKCVSFVDNGNVARVFASRSDAVSFNGVPSFDGDQRELVESLCRDVEEIGSFSKEEAEGDEETQLESGGSDQTSDSEENPRRNSGAEGNYEISGHYQGENENLIFSAPVPVKMETRAELIQKERLRKIEERLIGKK